MTLSKLSTLLYFPVASSLASIWIRKLKVFLLDQHFLTRMYSKVAGAVDESTKVDTDVDIVCTTCYIKGIATAQVTTTGNFNLSQAFENFTSNVEQQIGNVTNTTVTDLENWVHTLESDFITLLEHADFTDFVDNITFPTLNNTSFDLSLPSIPQAQLTFQIDGFEIYVAINTNLSASATYTFNIYKPETEVGIYVDEEFLGIIFEIDLILSSDGEIDMSSGFHIKLNDGFVINMALFSENVSSITK
jgi:hypothetical protein